VIDHFIVEMQDFWKRLRVRWHVLAVAFVAALPSIIEWLSGIDLRPILAHFLPDHTVEMIVGALPFLLIFLKSAVHTDAPEETDE
jgi:hypothetical protein